jgi:two-component system, OmpR family, sensor histidine kinase BaeS
VKKLMTRALVLVSGALLAFIFVLSVILLFSSRGLLKAWDARENAGLTQFLGGRLGALERETEDSGQSPTSESVARALEEMPYDPEWVVVLSGDDTLLFLYRRQAMQGGQGGNFLRRLQDISDWKEIKHSDGGIAFKYSSLVPSFSQKESNRILMATLLIIIIAGSVIAALIAYIVAYSLARPIARHAGALAASLELIGKGRRDLVLPKGSIEELDRIGRAAHLLQGDLAEEEDLRRRWAADIAHDLRTPLSVLKAQLEAMRDGVFAPSPERIGLSYREVLRLEKLVNDLALLTKLETPDFRPRLAELSVLPFLEEIAERFAEAAAAAPMSIGVAGEDRKILADRDLIDRALANIAENAMRYGEKGGAILLRSEPGEEGGTVIRVENSGLIDERILPFVFDRSFRADSSRESPGTGISPGSGLGLAIAKATAEALGARISVSRDEGRRTTSFSLAFTASLPGLPSKSS